MTRNLVKETEEKIEDVKPSVAKEIKPEEIKVVTVDELILNNLQLLISRTEYLNKIVYEGFRQVGVKFSEDK